MKIWADESEVEKRREICNGCEFRSKKLVLFGITINGIGSDQCKKCGCFLNAKLLLEGVKCPIDKW